MSFFIDLNPGSKESFLLFNLDTFEKKELLNNEDNLLSICNLSNESSVYCFDLYKLKTLFNSVPRILDLQSLYGLKLNRADQIDDLFDKTKDVRYFQIKEKIFAHLNSYKKSLINVKDFSLKEILPDDLYDTYLSERLLAIKNLLEKPIEKEILSYYSNKNTTQNILSLLSISSQKDMLHKDTHIGFKYNIFGSKNSRLSLRNDINLYNLHKDRREEFSANKDFTLFQFDYKSFQPRIAISLFGSGQMKARLNVVDDIYSIFPGDREKNKIELLSWMFSDRKNIKFDQVLSDIKIERNRIWRLAKKNGYILNPFNRPLFFTDDEENVVFQNYICSVEADCILRVLSEVCLRLKDHKSSVVLPFYDCLICSIHKDEFDKISDIKNAMEGYLYKNFLTKFPVQIKEGRSLGKLEDYTDNGAFMEAFSKSNPRVAGAVCG